MIGKDQEIAKPYRAIAIQIEPRFIRLVGLTQSKLRDEQQKIGKTNRAIAFKKIVLSFIALREEYNNIASFR